MTRLGELDPLYEALDQRRTASPYEFRHLVLGEVVHHRVPVGPGVHVETEVDARLTHSKVVVVAQLGIGFVKDLAAVALDQDRRVVGVLDRIEDRNLETIAQVGRTLEVVVDQIEDGQTVARSYREAPEIDGVVLLDRGEPGDWLNATVTGGYGTDLTATVVG